MQKQHSNAPQNTITILSSIHHKQTKRRDQRHAFKAVLWKLAGKWHINEIIQNPPNFLRTLESMIQTSYFLPSRFQNFTHWYSLKGIKLHLEYCIQIR